MEITWHGETCFRIKGQKTTVAVNPSAANTALKADMTLNGTGKEVAIEGSLRTFDWPGEYEMKEIPINIYETASEGGGDESMIFCFEVDGIKMCHIAGLQHTLDSDVFNEIGDVDVLMVEVGEGVELPKGRLMEVIEGIEPRAVIPMGKGDLASALVGIGVEQTPENMDKLVIKSSAELPVEQMRCVVLAQQA